eukprot:6642246-Pyramimonas_sp.AAC.1
MFNDAIQMGAFHAHGASGDSVFFLSTICEDANFQEVYCLCPASGIPSSKATTRAATACWA